MNRQYEKRIIKVNRDDYSVITSWVKKNSTVLDLGCGDGSLLGHLKENKNVTGYGVEILDEKVLSSLKNGINVIQLDLDLGLSNFENKSFDYVILSLTLQAVKESDFIINEMLRVGKEVIVTFPNFGFWKNRLQFFLGKMPVSKDLPYQWHDTPNIHLFTIKDFESYCYKNKITVLKKIVFNENSKKINKKLFSNFLGSVAIFRIRK